MNVMEVLMARNAKDDAERQVARSRLYQPPKQQGRRARPVADGVQSGGLTREAAMAMAAEFAAEQTQLVGGGGGARRE